MTLLDPQKMRRVMRMKAAAKITILWLCRPCCLHKGEDKADLSLPHCTFYTSLFLIIHPLRSTNYKAVGEENQDFPYCTKNDSEKEVPRPGLPYHRV